MASGPAPGGVTATIAAKCCRYAVAAVATMTVVASQAFIRRDRPALEQEVASCSYPCPWPEGREERTMDRMSTIMVKPEHREQKAPTWHTKCRSGFMTLSPALL
jgi:hypothetical protein